MRHFVTAVVCSTVFGLLLCWNGPVVAAFDDPAVQSRQALVAQVAREAQVVLIGTVVAVGPPPGIWSGRMAVRQSVVLQVSSVLKGYAPGPNVTVNIPVVAKSRLADSTQPALSPAIFKIGAILIVLANLDETRQMLDGLDENISAIGASPNNQAAIAALLH